MPTDPSGRLRPGLRRIWRENGLSIVVIALFVCFWTGQILTGWNSYNGTREDFHEQPVSIGEYLRTGHFVEATAENWESEFLEISMFAWLTSCLHQRGSAESKDPYRQEPETPLTPDSPWPARRGGWVAALYGHSLGLVTFSMFLISFCLHLLGGRCSYNEQQRHLGKASVSILSFLGTSDFWFQSFQNWQSEFVSIGMMVLLTIWLRQRDSPESKDVNTPNDSNE